MRTGLTVSAIGHLAFVAWGLLTFSSFEPLDAGDIEAVPFEFIAIDDISQIPIGVPTEEEPPAPPRRNRCPSRNRNRNRNR